MIISSAVDFGLPFGMNILRFHESQHFFVSVGPTGVSRGKAWFWNLTWITITTELVMSGVDLSHKWTAGFCSERRNTSYVKDIFGFPNVVNIQT